MSVDVSPDGEKLVFDMLGDLYSLPVEGGSAKRITHATVNQHISTTSGNLPNDGSTPAPEAFDAQPRFSPDGTQIAFISDRGGSDELWVMNRDGSSASRISDTEGVTFNSPAWSPDGDAIVVRRSTSLRTGELWEYPVHSSADKQPTALTNAKRIIDAQGPVFGPDGTFIYFAAPFEVDEPRQLRRETWQIGRLNRDSDKIQPVTDRAKGAVRPRVSPEGETLTYATWHQQKPSLVARDLETGSERILARNVERNLQDMYLSQLDLFPGYAFGPDGEFLYLSHHGQIRRLSIFDGTQETIPHSIDTTYDIPAAPPVTSRIGQKRTSRMLRWPDLHPETGRAVFEAIGRIWTVDLNADAPSAKPLTDDDLYAHQPRLSPDGLAVVFVGSKGRNRTGHVYRISVNGGSPEKLTETEARYARPVWSPDGERIYLLRNTVPRYRLARQTLPEQDIAWIPSNGGSPRTVSTKQLSDAGVTVSRNGHRLQFTANDTIRSISTEGGDLRNIADAPGTRRVVLSPDGNRAAMTCDNRVIVQQMNGDTAALTGCSKDAKKAPYAKRPGYPGYFPTWIGPRTLIWSFGGDLFKLRTNGDRSPQRIPLQVDVTNPARTADRDLVLTGARILTMTGNKVIEHGAIHIHGNRIKHVGPAGSVPVPEDATVKDVSGHTIMPGLIDVHQHALALMSSDPLQNLPRPFTPSNVLLAYGITSTRDPALISNVRDVSMIELINSGRVRSPRYTYTGERIQPSEYRIQRPADARKAVQIQKQLGAHYIKEYLQPNRWQRQYVAEAARQADLAVTLEGGFDYNTVVTGLFDGYTGTEHSAGNHPVYGDFTELVTDTQTFYTPTIMSQIGAEYYFQQSNVAENNKLQRFYPSPLLQKLAGRRRRGHGLPTEETAFPPLTENATRLINAGATVGVGAHDRPAPTGLGTHWEIWSYVRGGASPKQALRAATCHGARLLGASGEVGSLEAGKLADLLILDENPLDSIRHTQRIDRVMKSGILYDGKTLDRTWPDR